MSIEISKLTLEIFSKLEKKWLLQYNQTNKTRVLTIDGGGTNCINSGAALIHLEHQIQSKTGDSNTRIIDFFDIITGTGIGAILAVLININDGNGRPMYSAIDAVKFVNSNVNKLFKPKSGGCFNIFKPRLLSSGIRMESVLKAVLTREDGKVFTLKDTCKPILIPCYDLNSSAPFVFSRADAFGSDSFDFELWKVIRATSANPVTFKPFSLSSVDGKTVCNAVDGGLVMNNPTAIAVTHVLHNKRDFPLLNGVEELMVISIGNGLLTVSDKRKVNRNGECMTSSIVDIVLDGVSETVDQMLSNSFCFNRSDYVRIQVI